MRKMLLGYLVFFTFLLMTVFGGNLLLLTSGETYEYEGADGITYVAKTEGKQFRVYQGQGQWQDLFVAGVNLGSGKPGHYPGEFAITKSDYLRWFQYISDMNCNTIRVYIAQMPAFYQALAEFNQTAKNPLYLMHGVYLNEADIAELEDAYADDGRIRNAFLSDIKNVVDIVHGNADIEKTPGHAGGLYAADVSRYVIGWILGIEWEPEFVTKTNESNPTLTSYDGKYLRTAARVTPFEVMLAQAADTAISYETENYQAQRPLAMANWVTTDPLCHPGEPNPETEDAVSVDMENLLPKEGFGAGLFASYHAYPYYPDMFNYEQEYIKRGNGNTYKAYLEELNAHHAMPVLISEVGIPSSRGIAHENPLSDFNQGHVTETEQGKMLSSLVGDIHSTGCMGAIVFSWQDEWFKKTWNTQDMDNAAGRAFWMDYQTNEQSFGLLSFDPGEKKSVCYVDGDTAEWSDTDLVTQNGDYRLSMKSDEKFLYFMVDMKDFEHEKLYLPIDTIPGQGNTRYNGQALNMGADFMLVLDGKKNSTVLIDPYYDPTYFLFGVQSAGALERNPSLEKTDTGHFVPIRQLISRKLKIPQTEQALPAQTVDTGKLRYGVANPDSAEYDSLADFYCNATGQVEIRLPWLLLNVSDPSTGLIIGNLYKNNRVTHEKAGPVTISLYPEGGSGNLPTGEYSWLRWEDTPTSHERLKKSYYILGDTFSGLSGAQTRTRGSWELWWANWNQAGITNVSHWFPIQPYMNYLIAFLLSVILYFFLVLTYLHIATSRRKRRHERVKKHLSALVSKDLPPTLQIGAPIPGLRQRFSRENLAVLSELLTTLEGEEQGRLRRLIENAGFESFAGKHLHSRDRQRTILLVRMLGQLNNPTHNATIKELLYKHTNLISLQYQGLLALSLTADSQNLTDVCMDKKFKQKLSFRSLQEIFKVYTGNKEALYASLLNSPDRYIVRICIKRIGAEQVYLLAPMIFPFLDSDDYNLVIDAARSMGQLKWKDAGENLRLLLAHPKWEVRGTVVSALAEIDLGRYEDFIAVLLHDPEWQVRYNTAKAIIKSKNLSRILTTVEHSGDRYALEMLQYIVSTRYILEEATSCNSSFSTWYW